MVVTMLFVTTGVAADSPTIVTGSKSSELKEVIPGEPSSKAIYCFLHALSRNQSRDNVALPAEKRRVFLAYRSLFSGDNANLRQAKKIRKLVQKHSGSFGALIKDFGSDKTVDILKTLLEVRVFESDIQAKITFPDLFQTTLSRSVQRAASVNEVARSEAEALEELVLGGRINEFDEDADVERVAYADAIAT
ncbi:hypothetical protein VE01_01060 [Pseudogymnoascus verrucosus]|uniref:Uncharacterized protein n=1 Tax=Pseudogymnoascus verrucosus TaxID=342668 RepID=A0A1B8GXK4_9PEZI|nr:uncharacterized protein VE01_01060 [Pseudogymnoascus verrucosus]OBU00537.1 hypothetical protein VE01_01060 [Pseudogymnoascus verrucosus]